MFKNIIKATILLVLFQSGLLAITTESFEPKGGEFFDRSEIKFDAEYSGGGNYHALAVYDGRGCKSSENITSRIPTVDNYYNGNFNVHKDNKYLGTEHYMMITQRNDNKYLWQFALPKNVTQGYYSAKTFHAAGANGFFSTDNIVCRNFKIDSTDPEISYDRDEDVKLEENGTKLSYNFEIKDNVELVSAELYLHSKNGCKEDNPREILSKDNINKEFKKISGLYDMSDLPDDKYSLELKVSDGKNSFKICKDNIIKDNSFASLEVTIPEKSGGKIKAKVIAKDGVGIDKITAFTFSSADCNNSGKKETLFEDYSSMIKTYVNHTFEFDSDDVESIWVEVKDGSNQITSECLKIEGVTVKGKLDSKSKDNPNLLNDLFKVKDPASENSDEYEVFFESAGATFENINSNSLKVGTLFKEEEHKAFGVYKIEFSTKDINNTVVYCTDPDNNCLDSMAEHLDKNITEIKYYWDYHYKIDVTIENDIGGKIFDKQKVTISNLEGNDSIKIGKKTHWVKKGAKVKTSIPREYEVEKLTFRNYQFKFEDKDVSLDSLDQAFYSFEFHKDDRMREDLSGTFNWQIKKKVYNAEVKLGERFTLDSLGSIDDNILKQIRSYDGYLFELDINNTQSDSIDIATRDNTIIYSNQNIKSDSDTRDFFKGELYFTRPGPYRLTWLLDSEAGGITDLIVRVNVTWPETKIDHIAETNLVDLDPFSDDKYLFKEIRLSQVYDKNGTFIKNINKVDLIKNKKYFSIDKWSGLDDNTSLYRTIAVFTASQSDNAPRGDFNSEDVIVKVIESRHWSNQLVEENATIGEEITSSEYHDSTLDYTGYVMQTDDFNKSMYNTATYDPITQKGEIFAVNQESADYNSAIDDKDDLVVVWYSKVYDNSTPGLRIVMPNKAVRYTPRWPEDSNRIVVASRLGSDGLDDNHTNRKRQMKLDPTLYKNISIYNQPDRNKKGFNPNEEHALLVDSFYYSDAIPRPKAAYALRNDLNNINIDDSNYTSMPYVLVTYQERNSSKYKMSVYKVDMYDRFTFDSHDSYIKDKNADGIISEEESNSSFRYEFKYPIYAGDKVVAPYPLDSVIGANRVEEISGENTGTDSRAYWKDKDGNSWVVSGGSSFKGSYWYPMQDGFWHPTAKVSDIIPWAFNSKSNGMKEYSKYESEYFISDGKNYLNFEDEIDVTYDTYWRTGVPTIRLGETITFAGGEETKDNPSQQGVPSVVAWASAEVVYDEQNKNSDTKEWAENYTVKLRPAVRELKVKLDGEFPKEMLPATKLTKNINGNWYFEELHAGLKQRIYYDPMLNNIVLRGILNDKFAGDTSLTKSPGGFNYILQPNVMTKSDLDTLGELTGTNEILRKAFKKLFALSQNPTLNIEELNSLDKSSNNTYLVGLSRFLRDKNNKFLVQSELDINKFKQELSNGELPNGLDIDSVELVDKSALPVGVTIEDVETIAKLQKSGNKLVRIKEGKGYIPSSSLGSGLALFTNPKFLNTDSNFTSSYVVIAENNDASLTGSPVQLHIMKVINRPYRGQIKTVFSDNVFDEKITLRHTGDFGGNIKDLVFDWRYRETDGKEIPPDVYDDPSCSEPTNLVNSTKDIPKNWLVFTEEGNEVVFGKSAGKDVVVDNSFYVRYRHKDCNKSNISCWSGWAGSGGNNPCNKPEPVYKSQLVKGWVKRVTDKVNLFDARINDFSGDNPATYISMIEQIGSRYTGDVALNPSKNVIENTGLAALYRTVLNRAGKLTIDAAQPSSTVGVTQALQNAASRISKFYTLLGNEAYSDALDPTIGYTVSDTTGSLSTTLFPFMNQLGSLSEEELVLLRGMKREQESDSGAAPVHNRLIWNFTNGDGEVAYALNYNIEDKNSDGFIDDQDAKIMYPQGHGDAWGHYLTAVRGYYDLFRHNKFEWVSRSEMYQIDGITLDVDYYDERTFAEAAAYKAKVGSEVIELTYRDLYEEDPEAQWHGYKDNQEWRAWGVDGWVNRAHTGAYFDWVVANAILPAEDTINTGIQKIDRTTVAEIQELSIHGSSILTKISQIDTGLNPLGVLPEAISFDIDPSSSETYFEQIYSRAESALENAVKVFDYANDIKTKNRKTADSQRDFSEQVFKQDMEYRNRLIEIFGTPYDGTIGAGKVFPEGYNGPDVYFYNYVDVSEISEENMPIESGNTHNYLTAYLKKIKSKSFEVDISLNFKGEPNKTIAKFHEYFPSDFSNGTFSGGAAGFTSGISLEDSFSIDSIEYPLSNNRYSFDAPDHWGERKYPGRLQSAIIDMVKADVDFHLQYLNYAGMIDDLKRVEREIHARVELRDSQIKINGELVSNSISTNEIVGSLDARINGLGVLRNFATGMVETLKESIPTVAGLSNDVSAPARGAIYGIGLAATFSIDTSIAALQTQQNNAEADREVADLKTEIIGIEAEAEYDIKQYLFEIDQIFNQEPVKRLALFKARETVRQAAEKVRSTIGEGLRVMEEREAFNKRVAYKTQGRRYQDMAFRLNRNEAAQKYKAAFDMASRYAYLAAKAYDYETNLSPSNAASAQHILADIVKTRLIGEYNGGAVVGEGGLSEILAKLKTNYGVLKSQMGINNPQLESNTFSLKYELFRIKDSNSSGWQKLLLDEKNLKDDIWEDVPEFRTHMRPFASRDKGKQPALVFRFGTKIESGFNFFGKYLSSSDHAFDPSQYSTRIRSVGIRFEGYEGLGLAETARAYLVPIGQDYMYVADSYDLDVREWNVKDQKIAVPLPFGKKDIEDSSWMPIKALNGADGLIRKHSRMRVYHDSGEVDASQMNNDTRLFGRSVWNNEWLLIIPGESLLGNREKGLYNLICGKDNVIENRDGNYNCSDSAKTGITDIKLIFDTYSYSGN